MSFRPHSLPRGVYVKNIPIYSAHLSLHRRLIPSMRVISKQLHKKGEIDPLSMSIINSVPSLAVVPCVILAALKIRWKELQQLTIADFRRTNQLLIHQSKTKVDKCVDIRVISENIKHVNVPAFMKLVYVSYDSLKNSIRLAAVNEGIYIAEDIQDSTHIFRHLWASWAHSRGIPSESIAQVLGHKSTNAISSYIHGTLYP